MADDEMKRDKIPCNTPTVTLADVLNAASDKVDGRRLTSLQEKLERAFNSSCSEIAVEDPILIRRRLIEYMRQDGASEGMVQSYEQLFMGVARRAALRGVIQPPPEGPWTHRWQRLLIVANEFKGTRMGIRSLAAWATAQGIQPEQVNSQALLLWVSAVSPSINADGSKVQAVISEYRNRAAEEIPSSILSDRLKQKALRGSVRTVEEVYGAGRLQKEPAVQQKREKVNET